MGNQKSKEETIKEKGGKSRSSVAKSISLRSITNAEKCRKLEKSFEEDIQVYTESYVDEINQRVFAPKINSIFCPEFGFRSDISSSNFKYLSKLGEGTFSTVYRASWLTKKDVIVAIKVQNKSIILKKGASKQIKRESDIHKDVSHSPFIACYYDCWQTSNHLFTVMECIDGHGDLYTLWKENKTFSENAIRIYAAEIAIVLDFLKTKNVVYRDFKMENLALDFKRHIKLIDFGFARKLMGDERASTVCGTLQYMPPEVAKEQEYGFEVDWWCFGVVLYVISENQYPYSCNTAKCHSELSYDSPITFSNTSAALKDLISKLLDQNPNERLSCIEDLKNHKFFPKTFQFDNLLNHEIDITEIKQIIIEKNKKPSYTILQW